MIDVTRSDLAPESLARRQSWNDDDVLLRLHADFHGKCYLCESKVQLRNLQVDHRLPRHTHPELSHDWSDLCPTCGLCNQRRPRYAEPPALLDPCAGEEVRTRLVQRLCLSSSEHRFRFSARDVDDLAATATAAELLTLHSPPHNAAKRAKAKELRDEIQRAHEALSETLMSAWRAAQCAETDDDVRAAHDKLDEARARLAPDAEFSALLSSALGDLVDAIALMINQQAAR